MTQPPPSPNTHIVTADDLHGVARNAADLFRRVAGQRTPSGRFTVALSGGSTPRALHGLLASPPYRDQINWSAIEFFWGDDRCVPPDDRESNYRMARETLLSLVPVQEDQIHRMRTELPPEQAAEDYAGVLRDTFHLESGQLPRFDLIFLGMGPDGHTLSLFPHTAALTVADRLVTANFVPKLNTHRVTFTYPVANHAAAVAFMVAGHDKADALAAVLEGPRNPAEYPSQGVAPTNGELYWFVDRTAAANLKRTGGPAS